MTLTLFGCSTLLPSSKKSIESPWGSFEEAKSAFEIIVPGESTTEHLKSLGFDPDETPNLRILNYLDLTVLFMPTPSIRMEDLDQSVQECIASKKSCKGYKIEIKKQKKKRYGNLFLDLFNFKRSTKESGWEFNALVVLKDELVVYKLWSGKPIIHRDIQQKNPLGPLQSPEEFVTPDFEIVK